MKAVDTAVSFQNLSNLKPRCTAGALSDRTEHHHWRLQIPAGPAGIYRLAQLDDYRRISRKAFPHTPPIRLFVEARASASVLPGTWGFGFWNDPFGIGLPGKGGGLRFPVLPNAAWFFHASPSNHLSIYDHLAGSGWMACVIRSGHRPGWLPWLAAPMLPLLVFQAGARWLRKFARRFVTQDTGQLAVRPSEWHSYRLLWEKERVIFEVDGDKVFETAISPVGRLGLVMWVDNQFLAFTPEGGLRYGLQPNEEPAWLEFTRLELDNPGTSV